MKIAKRIITLAISLATVFSVCIHVPAANENNVKKYNYYVAVGDSIPAGFYIDTDRNGLGDEYSTDCFFGRIEGSYPDIIARATSKDGEDSYHSATAIAMSSKSFAYVLGCDVDEEEVKESTVSALKGKTGYFYDGIYRARNELNIGEDLKNADLITIGFGTNDLIMHTLIGASKFFESDEIDVDSAAREILKLIVESYAEFIKYFQFCADYIIENNTRDADVFIIGMYNPYKNAEVTGDEFGILGKLYGAIVTSGNTMLRTWALRYGFTYIDVRSVPDICEHLANVKVETDGSIEDLVEKMRAMHTHPDYFGHEYMAELILAKMPDTLVETSLRNGNLELKINGSDAGMYGFTKEQDGWLIRDLDTGLYLTYKNGNITLSQEGTLWQYNGGFYVETTSAIGFAGGIARHYISWGAQGFYTSGLKKNATLHTAV